LELLALAGSVPVPVVGYESEEGIVIDVAWPDLKIAVYLDPNPDDCRDLEAAGWTLLAAETDALIGALSEAGHGEGGH
jgi:hypothetical protein